MAFLGRPSQGDSPMAIGDRAMRDTSSPQPPSQRNPLPRQSTQGMPGFGTMAAPSPYGAVSDEARRRYEERYAKKKQQEAEKAAAEAREQAATLQQQQRPPPGSGPGGHPPGYGGPPPGQNQGRPGPGPGQFQQQQQPPPPAPQWAQQQSGIQHRHTPPPAQINTNPPPRSQYGPPGSGGPPGPPGPPTGYQSPPPQHQQQFHQQQQQQPQRPQSQQQHYQQQQGPPPQQRWSNNGPPPPQQQQHGGPQWSQNAVPPPSQARIQVQSPPPPPHVPDIQPEDHELRSLFSQFDSSRSGQLNSYDLQRLLAKDATMDAREDCVKMLMNIFDTDRSGSINFMEFEGLYRYIKDWHGIFLRFDRDQSGTIDRKELHAALLGFGFSLPPEMVKRLEKKFAPPPMPGKENRGISFDRFLLACVMVKHYTEAFRKLDDQHHGRINLDYNQFMDLVLDSPS